MGTRQVSLVNAVGATTQRVARNRSAVIRVGKVVGAVADGMVTVDIGGATHPCWYGAWYLPYDGDAVNVLCDNDRYLVLGRSADTADAGVMRYRNGSVFVGDTANTTNYSYFASRNIDAKRYQVQMWPSATGANGLGMAVYENEIAKASLLLDVLAQLYIGDAAGELRPVPFATQCGVQLIPTNGTANATAAIVFDSSRFTDTPVVLATIASSVPLNGTARYYNQSKTGCTLGLASTQTMGQNYYVSWLAIQVTSAATAGLRAASATTATLVCPTVGCPNHGIPIDILADETVDAFACGVCGEFISDVTLN